MGAFRLAVVCITMECFVNLFAITSATTNLDLLKGFLFVTFNFLWKIGFIERHVCFCCWAHYTQTLLMVYQFLWLDMILGIYCFYSLLSGKLAIENVVVALEIIRAVYAVEM